MRSGGVVLFSGGLDSVATLKVAIQECSEVTALHFIYNQNTHKEELQSSKLICEKLGVKLEIVDISNLSSFLRSPYTTGKHLDDYVPAYVPNRNLLFITLAHSYAVVNNLKYIYIGLLGSGLFNEFNKKVLPEDRIEYQLLHEYFKGFDDIMSDGKDIFIDAVSELLKIQEPDNKDIELRTPLRGLSKAECFEIIQDQEILDLSRSCYNTNPLKFDWGFGCGECDSCKMRKAGYFVYKYRKTR